MNNINNFLLIGGMLIMLLPLSTNAQEWGDLGAIIGQLDSTEQINFLEELDNLQDSWHYGSVELGSIVDSLANGLPIYDPTAPVDSMLDAWANNREEILMILDTANLNMMDSLLIINEYDEINEIWDLNLDSLNSALELINDSLLFSPGLIEEAVVRFEVFEGLWNQIFDELEDELLDDIDLSDPQGLGSNIMEVFDTLFSESMFDLELAYGQEFADVRFYDENYTVTANVIRLASVPRFDTDFETSWYLKGSYFIADDMNTLDAPSIQQGFNGFLCDGGFSVMYNPMISCTNGVTFRLLSSLGMELSTYVPSHIRTGFEGNVGKTTGYGPRMGAGMIVTVGSNAFYTFGTLSQGDIVNGIDDTYRYHSRTVNAGLRVGDAINVLYTTGVGIWAPNNNKRVDYHRVTLGLILDELTN